MKTQTKRIGSKKRLNKAQTPPAAKRVSRTRKPDGMTLEEWQIALRREFGRKQPFVLKNLGSEPVFSDFSVTNPASGGTYKIAIRGVHAGDSYCSCPDFKVNTLGTCKHLEFALGKLERKRGGKAALRAGYHPPFSEVYMRYGSQREVRFRSGATCPKAFGDYAGKFFGEDGRLLPDAHLRFHLFLKEAPLNGHEVRCYEDAIQYVAQLRDDDERRKAVDALLPRGAESAAFKKLVKATLYPYQRQGALFAARSGRSIIADDMGLGKTIQAITATEILARTGGIERVLVVTPTSLKHQWKRELEKFAPHRSVQVVEGLMPKRNAAYRTDTFYKITNYDVVHLDVQSILAWRPDLVILDEAQRIKNWQTRRARCVKQLISPHAIVLTGTPLENRLEELHSIVQFVDQFRLGPLFRFLAAHQHTDESGRVIGYRNLSQVSKTLEPLLIRRTKDEVLKELPDRIDEHVFVPMTDLQWDFHSENQKTVGEIVQKWRRKGFLTEKEQLSLMIALQNMRMSCDSSYLLDKNTAEGVKAQEVAVLLGELLQEEGTKAVIFSQWLGMHELILDQIEKRGWNPVFYHGGLDGKAREKALSDFREDPGCRLFLATDAGGVGLNLQHASVVINMDQPWNPAVLEQRVGRVHRLGQQRKVRVFHFVAQGTIEHGMLDVLAFKKSVFAGVLDGGADEVFLGGTKLKKFMETVDQVSSNIPEAMPNAEQPTDETAKEARAEEEVMGTGEDAPEAREPAAQAANPWEEVVGAGLTLLGRLTKALQTPAGAAASEIRAGGLAALVEKDPNSGAAYVRLPVPDPEVLQEIAGALSTLAAAFQKGSSA
jgi:superfamily II DNA or RNA helicase